MKTILAIIITTTTEAPEITIRIEKKVQKDFDRKPMSVEIFRNFEDVTNITDVLRFSSGAEILDMGWRGALKTMMIRGSRAEGTIVTLDGIQVNNVQNGIADLSLLSLSSVERISFKKTPDFMVGGGEIAIQTPGFHSMERNYVRIMGGSFGYLAAELRTKKDMKNGFLFVSGNFENSEGEFKYQHPFLGERERRGTKLTLGSTTLKSGFRMGGTNITALASFLKAKRGASSTIFFEDIYEDARIEDTNIIGYIRAGTRKLEGELSLVAFNPRYENPDVQKSSFTSTRTGASLRAYLSWRRLKIIPEVEGVLERVSGNFGRRERPAAFTDVDLEFKAKRFVVQSKVGLGMFDRPVPSGRFGISILPLNGFTIFSNTGYGIRVPTFNEIYWQTLYGMESASLCPEKTLMAEAGLRLAGRKGKLEFVRWKKWEEDRIEWRPTYRMFIWVAENIGKVWIQGLEFLGEAKDKFFKLRLSYGMVTSEDERGKALPYIPKYQGSGALYIGKKILGFLRVKFTGERYTLKYEEKKVPPEDEKSTKPSLEPYTTVDVGLRFKIGLISGFFTCVNLLDKRYETIPGFPMPGRSFEGGIKVVF